MFLYVLSLNATHNYSFGTKRVPRQQLIYHLKNLLSYVETIYIFIYYIIICIYKFTQIVTFIL